MSAEGLEIAPWSIVPNILKILEIDYPDSLVACNTLGQYTKWKTKDLPDLKVILLTPGGKVDKHGTFLICAMEHRNFMTIYSLNPDIDELKSLVLNTKYLPWEQGSFWAGLHEKYYPILYEVFAIKNLKRIFPDDKGCALVMDRESAKKITISCPPEIYFDQLKEEEAEFIDFYWPHRVKNSAGMGKFMIKYNGGIGLYDKETKELIAWALINMHNCPGQLYVMDKYKRKGYGMLVAKAITKVIADRNIDPVVMIGENNFASQDLFQKIGYKKIGGVYWCVTAPQE